MIAHPCPLSRWGEKFLIKIFSISDQSMSSTYPHPSLYTVQNLIWNRADYLGKLLQSLFSYSRYRSEHIFGSSVVCVGGISVKASNTSGLLAFREMQN